MGAIVILAFYVGMLEGKRTGGKSVVLACSADVLSQMAIQGPQKDTVQEEATSETTPSSVQGMFAGSKNGTKYYTPGCAGLDRIKPENIIWFASVEDATLQGYTAAAC